MKFVTISDTHIRNLKYHEEYREVFAKLYDLIREEKPDHIIHCGDLAHTKTQLSPEFFDLASDFLKNLADITETWVLLGNHDGNLKNNSRQDAITPIVRALKHPRLHLLKKSGEHTINENFALQALSAFDRAHWGKPSNYDRVNIALYHGIISGIKTEDGWKLEGDDDVSIFKPFDYAFLGDVHEMQAVDEEGRCKYIGSTIQQSFAEKDNKGFLVWEIEDKEKFNVRHIIIPNPKPFVTIKLTQKGTIPQRTKIPEKARIRLISEKYIPLASMKQAIDAAYERFKPTSVAFLSRASSQEIMVNSLSGEFEREDIRDINTQNKLVERYLKNHELSENILEDIFELNRKYDAIVKKREDIRRNINWSVKSVVWKNLFNYGKDNYIDFEKLSGIVGIFGKNYIGKSSIIDSILYVLFNAVSKNSKKSLNIINQNKDRGAGILKLKSGNDTFFIERSSEKYKKGSGENRTTEAKTQVNFYKINEKEETISLNGDTRVETEKNIRSMFGTLDDFLLTSMASQLDSLNFISRGSTKRKEILIRFLGLDLFEKKYKLAKDEAYSLKGVLRNLEDNDFDGEEKKLEGIKRSIENTLERSELEKVKLQNKIAELEYELLQIKEKMSNVPKNVQGSEESKKEYGDILNELEGLKKKQKENCNKLKKNKDTLKKIDEFFETIFDVEKYKKIRETIEKNKFDIERIQVYLEKTNKELKQKKKKVKLLSEVPCNSDFSHCKFIKDAYREDEKIPRLERIIESSQREIDNIVAENERLNEKHIVDSLEKYYKLIEKKETLEKDNEKLDNEQVNSALKEQLLNEKLINLKNLLEEIEQQEKLIKDFKGMKQEKREIEKDLKFQKEQLGFTENNIVRDHREHAACEQKIEAIQEKKESLEQARKEYQIYDLFMKCMGNHGIVYDVIKEKLPIINEEITKALVNIVNFNVFFENEDSRLNVFIKHPKYGARPLEMCSGAEKTIAAMAIRLALLKISSLPHSDIFILDEPGTSLDEDNMEGFVRVLEMIKSSFKTVFLISHLDSLKDVVDSQIIIEKKKGYASVNV